MDLCDLITPGTILPGLKVASKKQLLQAVAAEAATKTELGEREIFDVLLQRERLGSTGVGQGVAIPHGKIAGLDSLFCVFARLETPIAFDAVDDVDVDLAFLLLAPIGAGADHLKALACISRLARQPGALDKLRGCKDPAGLFALLTQSAESDAA